MATIEKIMKIVAVTVVFIVVAVACSGRRDEMNDRTRVSVTLPPLEYFVEAIGGDRVDVNVLLRNGADPETFEPGISVMKNLSDSELLFATMLMPFEQNVAMKITTSRSPRVVNVAEGISLIRGTHEHVGEETSHEHGQNDADPHVWASVGNAHAIAKNVVSALVAADAENADYYMENYRKLENRLDSLGRDWALRLEPCRGGAFAIEHPSLSYFAAESGLKQLSLNSGGHKESSAKGRAELLDAIRQSKPLAFFVEPGADAGKNMAAVEAVGIGFADVNTMDADWERMMERVVDALSTGVANRDGQ